MHALTWSEAVVDSMVVTTDLLTKSTMEVARKKEATVSEENTMMTHTAFGGEQYSRLLFRVSCSNTVGKLMILCHLSSKKNNKVCVY